MWFAMKVGRKFDFYFINKIKVLKVIFKLNRKEKKEGHWNEARNKTEKSKYSTFDTEKKS